MGLLNDLAKTALFSDDLSEEPTREEIAPLPHETEQRWADWTPPAGRWDGMSDEQIRMACA
jgi:hypothetical protein